jgi:glycosyltransferase involved in cell wall biosynthesis
VFLEYLLLSLIPELDVDLYIVHTENQRDALDSHKEEGTKINVIPHGAYSVFGDHTDLDVKPEQNTILFFGNLVPPKGIDTFIEAIPHVARSIPDVTAVIAGDGSIPTESRRVIEAHPDNFEVHNHFIPNGEVKHFFGRAQVLALPYRSQAGTKGHSGVLSSAFSFGKPVVASSAGVFPQYVEAAGTGYVVPPDDPEALSRALTQILRNDDERNTMATRCLEMADQLSWDRIAEKHIDQYESLLETNRDSSPPTEAQYLEAHDE